MTTATDGRRSSRQRVVLVGDDLFWQWMLLDFFSDAYEVTSCPGPEFLPGGCPVLAGERCPLIEPGSVVVTRLDSSRPANHSVACARKTAYPGNTVIHLPH